MSKNVTFPRVFPFYLSDNNSFISIYPIESTSYRHSNFQTFRNQINRIRQQSGRFFIIIIYNIYIVFVLSLYLLLFR